MLQKYVLNFDAMHRQGMDLMVVEEGGFYTNHLVFSHFVFE